MSDYSPIADHSETTFKKEQGSHSQQYSSHPYSSSYSGTPPQSQRDTQAIHIAPAASSPSHVYGGEPTAGPSTFNSQDGGQRISRYETSLSLRYDVEASLAYALGVFSGALLLVMEKKNDYVRFHAWQSALLSIASFVVLVLTALIFNSLYWLVFLAAGCLHIYMIRRAYLDGAVFERYPLPYIGPLAMQLVDEE
ncbi:hypothetical protein H4R99_007206 [Coemansia sp. RSA 1722]|nr:hypothetical protein LPJ57_005368 [Coemansia sp. RSA 486]KAJ2234484.1 hypothetical protein IWW45_003379 [Coemansia sp. RSA 485]KAJ2590128.1 hypothetical protein H4R99_007206 [Coemansia sp. RSA 1722]